LEVTTEKLSSEAKSNVVKDQ